MLLLQASLLELGGRLAQVFDAVDEDRAIPFEVVRQQDVRRAARQLDHGHAGSHPFDGKTQPAAEDVYEVPRVRRDISARRVEVVELLEGRQLLSTRARTQSSPQLHGAASAR